MSGGQIRECTAYAEKNGFTVVKHYIDRAVSAKTDNRPQFQQMIKDSERGIFDVIIVWKLDRFGKKERGLDSASPLVGHNCAITAPISAWMQTDCRSISGGQTA